MSTSLKKLGVVFLSLALGFGLSACKEQKKAETSALPVVSEASEPSKPQPAASADTAESSTQPVRAETRGYSMKEFKEDVDAIEKDQVALDKDREALLDKCIGVSDAAVVQACKDERKNIVERTEAIRAKKQAIVDRVKAMRQESQERKKKVLELLNQFDAENKNDARKGAPTPAPAK